MPRGESKSSVRRIQAKQRQKQALELRLAGVTFEVIAERLHFRSRQGAHDAVTRALQDTIQRPADELRAADIERLDRLFLAVWPLAIQRNLAALDRCLHILAQRARLLGLDIKDPAPGSSREKPLWVQGTDAVDLSTATDAELEEIIAKAQAIQTAGRIVVEGRQSV